jgi:hypothetical protein
MDSLQDCLVKIGVVEVTRGVSLTALPLRVYHFRHMKRGSGLGRVPPTPAYNLNTKFCCWLLHAAVRLWFASFQPCGKSVRNAYLGPTSLTIVENLCRLPP